MQQVIARALGLPRTTGQGASSTAEAQFLNNSDALAVAAIAGEHLKDRAFRVRATGRAVAGAAGNLTIKLYHNDPDLADETTIANNTQIATSGAIALTNGESRPWQLEADLTFDEIQGLIAGTFQGHVNAGAVARAAVSNVSTEATLTQRQAFSATFQFSASNASNACFLDSLQIVA